MDEFEVYRSRAYSSGEYNMHRHLSISNSLPCSSSSQSPDSVPSRHYPSHHHGRDTVELDRLAELRISEAEDKDSSDHVFSPVEENLANRMLSQHGGTRNGSPFSRSGTASPTYFHAHHNRSHSCRGRQAKRPRELELAAPAPMRRRTYSMPTKNRYRRRGHCTETHTSDSAPQSRHPSQGDEDDDYIRVRTFSTSAKGIVNRGDSFKKRSSQQNVDVVQLQPGVVTDDVCRSRTWSNTSAGSSVASGGSSVPGSPRLLKVVVMGAQGVGKTSIIHQFMTSEYMANSDNSLEDDDLLVPQSVSVLLDGTESTLQFICQSPDEDDPDTLPNGDAYIVVYSVTDHESFDDAVDLLHDLRKKDLLTHTAVILVANKSDIVRLREVMEEDGKTMATRYDVKYIEISAVLNHRVDELLVGILKQIRLKEKKLSKLRRKKCLQETQQPSNGTHGCLQLNSARTIVGRLFRRHPMFRSCDNLLVS